MKTIGIIANLRKKNARVVTKELVEWLRKKGLEVIQEKEGIDKLKKATLVIALGGDGTLLHTAHLIAETQAPILAVNLGGLGFLTEVTLEELYHSLKKILKGDYALEKRMMIKAQVGEKEFMAVNDIVITTGALARVITLKISIDKEHLSTYSADGLIVSTPTGSSAYSLSAGGPIVNPQMKGIILTPICPHTLAIRPLVISENETVHITVKSNHNNGKITVDGQEGFALSQEEKIKVKKAPYFLNLVKPEKRSFYQILRTKLRWGGLKVES